jgi:hypothetical protein
MVSLLSLYLLAATLLFLTSVVGWLRRTKPRDALADGCAALVGTLLVLAASVVLFAVSQSFAASELWRKAGSLALLVSPLGATLALRFRGRRSLPRALFASAIALVGAVLWLTLNLRGPRGGWTLIDVALVLPAVAIAVASGACLGWWSKRKTALVVSVSLLLLLAVGGCDGSRAPQEQTGTLELTIRDAATGEPTSARTELLDQDGRAVVPDDALAIFADCGNVPVHTWVPGFPVLQTLWNRHREIPNPYTGTTQFYTDGKFRVRLPAGSYSVRATKGPEYKGASGTIVVEKGQVVLSTLDLVRWIDLAREGWYSADDHLHIPRPHPRFDPGLGTWMEAEGLHVANLLSGQENPRTHVLGHALVLGAHRFIDLPRQYLLYDHVWEEAHRQGAVNGYAHWGLAGAEEGLAVWGHEALLDFVEVLNLGFPFYDRWYEALDLGIRIGPTAGTDYPCLEGLPGRDRFYAKLNGPLDAEAWLEAVRQGRTFVTNGPAIELSVEQALPGEELVLAGPGEVRVSGRVRFDPDRDAVTALELIRGGTVLVRVDAPTSAGEIRLQTTLEIERTSWLALRATGVKRGETEIDLRGFFSSMLVLERDSNEELLRGLPEGPVARPSAAHTGAILVTVDGTPPLAEQPRGREVARIWLARLDELERRLDEDRMNSWTRFPGRGDGIDPRTARANRSALLRAIEAARRHHSVSGP